MIEPTGQVRILLSIQHLVDNGEKLGILASRSITNTIGVVQEVLVQLFKGLEN